MTSSDHFKYRIDPDTGVFIRDSFDPKSFNYSDTAEEFLLSLFQSAKELSSGSEEILGAIRDWPTEYHLSLARTNLLRGFDLSRFRSVLEIGCGCGAITRQLGELGLSVTALDGSFQRAAVTRTRCRDLSHVRVICENFETFDDSHQYDFVTLIGVLEYAPAFINSESPFEDMLLRAKSFLKPNGVLLIAIENLLGLKYFAGHEEDHVAKPFWGIQGLYQPRSARTLGRVEMDLLLERAGFKSRNYFYPFPDYKLPEVVISEAGASHSTFNPADVVAAHDARSYNSAVNLAFDEGLVWESLCGNKLLPHMSNSFLIFASQESSSVATSDSWLAKKFSISHLDKTVVTTSFVAEQSGDVRVYKNCSGYGSEISPDFHSQEEYVSGRNLLFGVRRAMACNQPVSLIADVLKPWVELLLASRVGVSGEWTDWKLPRMFFDCVPHNVLIRDGEAYFIDRQDSAKLGDSLDFSWIVLRGMLLTLAKSNDYGCFENWPVVEAVRAMCACFGFEVSDSSLSNCLEMEERHLFRGQLFESKNFFLKSFVGTTLQSRVRHLDRRLFEQQTQLMEQEKRNIILGGERDKALRLHRKKTKTLNRVQLEQQMLQSQIARKDAELRELRAQLMEQEKQNIISGVERDKALRLHRKKTKTLIRTQFDKQILQSQIARKDAELRELRAAPQSSSPSLLSRSANYLRNLCGK